MADQREADTRATASRVVYQRAFDALAPTYDADFTGRADAVAVRQAVWRELDARLRPGHLVVELGCGTGADARHLAERGVRVLATDLSPVMVSLAAAKLRRFAGSAHAAQCDLAAAADEVPLRLVASGLARDEERVDAILSNFGPLNCVPDLNPLFSLADRVLAPGGWLFCGVINRVYLREIARGVIRRFRPNGSPVPCGGERVPLYYHAVRSFRRAGYRIDAIVGLAVLGRDDVRTRAPLNRCADHVLVVSRRAGPPGACSSCGQ